jgi:hypothetical protein
MGDWMFHEVCCSSSYSGHYSSLFISAFYFLLNTESELLYNWRVNRQTVRPGAKFLEDNDQRFFIDILLINI